MTQEQFERSHTPTPWRFNASRCAIESTVSWLAEPDAEADDPGIPITVTNLTGAMGGEDGDVDFIVRACNSFDALKAAIDLFAYVRDSGRADLDADEVRTLENAITALSQGGGK